MPLVVQLDDASLSLPRPLDPATWRVTPRRNEEETVSFLSSSLLADKDAYVSVDQEEDGQHLYVRLLDAREGKVVALISEAEVKLRTDAILLYARDPATNVTGTGAESSASSLWNHPDLAPHGAFTNYSVVPWLSLGRTQALILTDEATLCRNLPNERIFEHVTLIVNCHENKVDTDKYKIRSNFTVISRAVHKWVVNESSVTVEWNDDIQKAIWHHLQNGGSVAVHCLAGIHRAAAIVACQFLFRHYRLGHTHISSDPVDIYKKLVSVRPAVRPAYVDVLRSYHNYCKAHATDATD